MQTPRNSKLFIYGTLLHAEDKPEIAAALRQGTQDLGEAEVPGLLYALEGYPGAVFSARSGQSIRGHLLEVIAPDSLWPVLDAYEEFDPRNPQDSEFVPVEVQVSWRGEKVSATTYAYTGAVTGLTLIPRGDWLSHHREPIQAVATQAASKTKHASSVGTEGIPRKGIAVAEAESLIARYLQGYGHQCVALADAFDAILAEDLRTDRDWPPYDRIAMDGIAVSGTAWESGQRRFTVEGSQYAGAPAQVLQNPHGCFLAMTGAILPVGCDRVIRIEEVTLSQGSESGGSGVSRQGEAVVSASSEAGPYKNVHRKGVDRQAGELVLRAGQRLRAPEIGIAASLGKSFLLVQRRPKVAVVTTGDELVPVDNEPLPHQVRRSNGPALVSALRGVAASIDWRHLPDHAEALAEGLREALRRCDILVLTGGVSMGEKDLVPAALKSVGCREIFHKVKQRPGKPFWFGIAEVAAENAAEGVDGGENSAKPVFGLPGNPVSTLACFHRYVLPALRKSMGHAENPPTMAALACDWKRGPKDFTVFLPCRITAGEGGRLLAHPVPNQGSGDFAALQGTDGFMALDPDEVADADSASIFRAGKVGRFFAWG